MVHPRLRLLAVPLLALVLSVVTGHEALATATKSKHTVYDYKARLNDGTDTSLKRYKGRVLLIVNTASQCGYTPQYEGLEALYQRFKDRGFEVLAFPANDFGKQEPGTDAEIREFCTTEYHVTFPLFAKISVKGEQQHPLYRFLTTASEPPGDVRWNFSKFLVGSDGRVVARFDSKVAPESTAVTDEIEKLLVARAN